MSKVQDRKVKAALNPRVDKLRIVVRKLNDVQLMRRQMQCLESEVRFKDAMLAEQKKTMDCQSDRIVELERKIREENHRAEVNKHKAHFYQELLHKAVDVHSNSEVRRSETIGLLCDDIRNLRGANSCNSATSKTPADTNLTGGVAN